MPSNSRRKHPHQKICILHPIRFGILVALFLVGTLLFAFSYAPDGSPLAEFVGYNLVLILLLFDTTMPYSAYRIPAMLQIWTILSFFLILAICLQTDLKNQRLTRWMLGVEAVNIYLIAIILAFSSGGGWMILYVSTLLFVLLFVPTIIVIKVKEKNGTYDYQDILTEEEREARLKGIEHRKQQKEQRKKRV